MSGPVHETDVRAEPLDDATPAPGVEVWTSRISDVGGATVHRALPVRTHRTIGAWCFLDHFGPKPTAGGRAMTIGPHPHIGLQTVTWLLEGEILHTDSLGSEQRIRPGQLNLMSAGHGVVHAEDSRASDQPTMHGVQLWVAQPEATRNGPAAFEHHAELPVVSLAAGTATVLAGSFAGSTSPARTDTPLVGVELAIEGEVELPLDPTYEYGLTVLMGEIVVDDITLEVDRTAYLGVGTGPVRVQARPGTRALLLGGEPCVDEIFMWWNFVARTKSEAEQAYAAWASADEGRFGPVVTDLARIDAPRPHWLT